jgi:hypothetical protein
LFVCLRPSLLFLKGLLAECLPATLVFVVEVLASLEDQAAYMAMMMMEALLGILHLF